jgi:hypothetical protein
VTSDGGADRGVTCDEDGLDRRAEGAMCEDDEDGRVPNGEGLE